MEKAYKACVRGLILRFSERRGRRVVEIEPIPGGFSVFFHVSLTAAETSCHERDGKIVVAVFKCTGDGAGHGTETFVIEILDRNVAEGFP